ncbi:hypothetical protein [Algicella marina]|uniref:Uncharacterized protein n=1 Tax=Algicella marina TaxID=2683284 RepID=A0A6P1T102_9RHOB|nr:hypothetical protein [Algicella marina]QHQ35677.1 hypothetical protein GO499_11060 [Algicella marina]
MKRVIMVLLLVYIGLYGLKRLDTEGIPGGGIASVTDTASLEGMNVIFAPMMMIEGAVTGVGGAIGEKVK